MNVVETLGLGRSYGSVRAVVDLGLEIPRGEIYGFLGLNGAGKTTTIRMLLGLIKPDCGTICLFGESLHHNRLAILGRIGSLVETASAWPKLTVGENLKLQAGLLGLASSEVQRVIGLLGLSEYQGRLAGQLSLGNRQRLSLARSLLGRPELLLLDEPANGLDPAGIVEIRALLRHLSKEEGTTIVMSSHLLAEVEHLADRVGIMHRGRLIKELHGHELTGAVKEVEIELELKQPEELDRARALLGRYQPAMGVRTATQHGGFRLSCYQEPGTNSILPSPAELNRLLVEAGFAVSRLDVVTTDLETIFLRLTGGDS